MFLHYCINTASGHIFPLTRRKPWYTRDRPVIGPHQENDRTSNGWPYAQYGLYSPSQGLIVAAPPYDRKITNRTERMVLVVQQHYRA